jgi:hypothetical protein
LQGGVIRLLVDLRVAIKRYLAEHDHKPKPSAERRSRPHYRKGQSWVASNRVEPLAALAPDHDE